MKPGFELGNDIGRLDKEIIPLLPEALKVIAGAGAGFDWVDIDLLGKRGHSIISFSPNLDRDLVLQWCG